jgi:hypothetical protein
MRAQRRTMTAIVGGTILAGVLTACAAATPGPTVTATVTVTQTPPAATGDPLAASDLRTLTAPAMCKRPAGDLVDGKLPVSDPTSGRTELATDAHGHYVYAQNPAASPYPAFAVAFDCDAGNVAWPEVIGFYGFDGELLDSYDLGDFGQPEHAVITAMHYSNGALSVKWKSYDGADFGQCDPTKPDEISADFRLGDSGVVSDNVTTPCNLGGE